MGADRKEGEQKIRKKFPIQNFLFQCFLRSVWVFETKQVPFMCVLSSISNSVIKEERDGYVTPSTFHQHSDTHRSMEKFDGKNCFKWRMKTWKKEKLSIVIYAFGSETMRKALQSIILVHWLDFMMKYATRSEDSATPLKICPRNPFMCYLIHHSSSGR